jgi:hypothetical protein
MIRVSSIFFATLFIAGPAFAGELSAADVNADITKLGAAATVKQLDAGSSAQWNAVIAHISGGSTAWLSVAGALGPGVDAGTGEDLTGALSAALLKNPAGVLKLAGPQFPISQICTDPQIEPTDAQVAAWKQKADAALAKITDHALTANVGACRAAIASN